jgi:hypothetical protein
MKKYIIVTCICTIALLFAACDPYANKKPYNYKDTKWVSTDPDIYFEVSNKYYALTGTSTLGQLITNDVVTEIYVNFASGRYVVFEDLSARSSIGVDTVGNMIYSSREIFSGDAKFYKDKMILEITHNEAGLLPDDVKEITFVREPLE